MNVKISIDYSISYLIIDYIIMTHNPLDNNNNNNNNIHIIPSTRPSESSIHNSRKFLIGILDISDGIQVITINNMHYVIIIKKVIL